MNLSIWFWNMRFLFDQQLNYLYEESGNILYKGLESEYSRLLCHWCLATTHRCPCCIKATIYNVFINECGCVPIVLNLQKQAEGLIWSVGHGLLTPDLQDQFWLEDPTINLLQSRICQRLVLTSDIWQQSPMAMLISLHLTLSWNEEHAGLIKTSNNFSTKILKERNA